MEPETAEEFDIELTSEDEDMLEFITRALVKALETGEPPAVPGC